MPDTPTLATRPFVDALMQDGRLVSEKLTTPPATTVASQPRQMQLKVDGNSEFTIGLDDLENPTNLQVSIDYKIVLKVLNTENRVAEYEARHAIHFTIVEWGGFSDWTFPPGVVMRPYMAVAQRAAMRRAEITFFEAGLKGIALPMPTIETMMTALGANTPSSQPGAPQLLPDGTAST